MGLYQQREDLMGLETRQRSIRRGRLPSVNPPRETLVPSAFKIHPNARCRASSKLLS
jgi:hypothetical protein